MSVKQKEVSSKPTLSITVKREFGDNDLFEIYAAYTAKKIAEKIFLKNPKKVLTNAEQGDIILLTSEKTVSGATNLTQ